MDGVHARRRLLKFLPGVVSGLVMDGFLALQPQGHLFDIVTFVAGLVGVLSVVDV